jgi:hypothetical protein
VKTRSGWVARGRTLIPITFPNDFNVLDHVSGFLADVVVEIDEFKPEVKYILASWLLLILLNLALANEVKMKIH